MHISGECSNKPLTIDSPSDKAEDVISGEDGDVYLVVHTNGKDIEEWVGPHSLFNFTRRTLKSSILSSAIDDHQFCADPYISENKVKSVLCMPIMVKNNLNGILYLENNHYVGLFTKHRMDLLLVLTSQLAISLENTRFFNTKMKEQIAKLRLEQLTHDEERQRLRADAAEKYRLQLENFVDMICHEIRNPLNGIFGNSDLIAHYLECIETMLLNVKKERNNDEIALRYEQELRGYLEHIKVSAGSIQVCAEHQKCITDDVLQLSKLRANKLGLSNHFFLPADLLNTVVRMFGVQAARKGLNIIQALPEGKFENMQVWADSLRIKQIITNLLSNAIKFTHKGHIKISLIIDEDITQERARIAQYNADDVMGGDEAWIPNDENDENKSNGDGATNGEPKKATSDTNKTTISPQKEKGEVNGVPVKSCYLKITIEDTGIGMTPDELSRIFTRFSQANNRTAKEYGGSGLGLAICKLLAKQMGGNLHVESIKDVGSTFYLSIFCERPIGEIHSPTINQSVIQSPKTKPPSTASVLVVEDNLMNQMLLSRILKIKGYAVHVANNGLEGLELYQQYALNPASSPFGTPTPSPSPSPKSSHTPLTTSPFSFPSVISNFVTNSASLPSPSPPQRPKLPDSPVLTLPTIPLPAKSNIFSTVQITSSTPSSPAESPSAQSLMPVHNTQNTQNTQNTNKQEQRKSSTCTPNTPFEFILMDMQMPIMDGLEATSRIRAFEQKHKLRPATIIGLSGNARSEHRDNALAAGMDHYLAHKHAYSGSIG